MKNMKFISTTIILCLLFSCMKETNSNDVNNNAINSTCDQTFEGIATVIDNYTYPTEIIYTEPNIRYTLSYDALIEVNQFEVFDGAGNLVATTNGYVNGTGTLSFLVCPESSLPFKLVVKTKTKKKTIEKWFASLSCSPELCNIIDPCCNLVYISSAINADVENFGCCLISINFNNASACPMPIFKDGIKIATLAPKTAYLHTVSLCPGSPSIIFSFGPSLKNPCKKFTTPKINGCIPS